MKLSEWLENYCNSKVEGETCQELYDEMKDVSEQMNMVTPNVRTTVPNKTTKKISSLRIGYCTHSEIFMQTILQVEWIREFQHTMNCDAMNSR